MGGIVQKMRELKELIKRDGADPETFLPSCVGCGFCCIQATCSLGVGLFVFEYPCPGLHWDGEKYRCRLAKDFGDHLYIGVGCCSPMNSWRRETPILERREEFEKPNYRPISFDGWSAEETLKLLGGASCRKENKRWDLQQKTRPAGI